MLLSIGALSLGAAPASAYIVFPGVSASAVTVIRVTNATELNQAVANATGPTEIVLAAGNYGTITIANSNQPFDIVLRSESDTNRAVMDGLTVRSSSRLRFDRINFDHVLAAGEANVTSGVTLSSASSVSFSSCTFSGTRNADPNDDGMLMRVRGSSKILVFGSLFQQSRSSAFVDISDNVFLLRNTFQESREGLNFDGATNIFIELNLFRTIAPNLQARDHSDAIQFYIGASGKTSAQILVSANAFILNDNAAHGVFVRSNAQGSPTHSNFNIRQNVYYGPVRQGIWVQDVRGLTIDNNSIVTGPGVIYEPAIYLKNVTLANVRKNIAPLFLLDPGTTANMLDNVDLYDVISKAGPTAQSQFKGVVSGFDPPVTNFAVLPGSLAATLRAGASVYATTGGMTGTFAVVEAQFQKDAARVAAR
jgi:hypothetical protein